MLRRVAPKALRRPISRVRSVTDTSMILITPMAPRPSVTSPTAPRNVSMASEILPTISAVAIESQSSKASGVSGSKL